MKIVITISFCTDKELSGLQKDLLGQFGKFRGIAGKGGVWNEEYPFSYSYVYATEEFLAVWSATAHARCLLAESIDEDTNNRCKYTVVYLRAVRG